MKIKKARKKKNNFIWIGQITVMAFFISFIFSFLSETLIPNVPILIGVILLFLFIGIGIIFDMIGLAVTTVNAKSFHAMSAKKIKSAKVAVLLTKNAEKVSSFCNDVIGDICGIISGSAGAIIASTISINLGFNIFYTTLVIMALIASITIGGKALGKGIAISNNVEIVNKFSKIIAIFYKPKN